MHQRDRTRGLDEQLAAIPAVYRVVHCPELRDATRALGRRLLEATGGNAT